jgi:hypothetical protein
MFDGLDIRAGVHDKEAEYWGKVVGIDGFFVNELIPDWQSDVGTDPQGKDWQLAEQFQNAYAKQGVDVNFIKIAFYHEHDWRNAEQNSAAASHLAHAAALATAVGFKGIALDLEPYVDIWAGRAGGVEMAPAVYAEGKAIAQAMHDAYPSMSLIIIQDALGYDSRNGALGEHGGYKLAVPFVKGLLSVPWADVAVATEQTYDGNVTALSKSTLAMWKAFVNENRLPNQQMSVAPGLWPLGKSKTDKSARMTPQKFAQGMADAYSVAPNYAWIYGYNSAWQTDGAYGKGPVAPGFDAYPEAIRRVKSSCH